MADLYGSVAQAVSVDAGAGSMPVVLSGDCSTSLGVVAGLQRAGIDPAVVWLDAHGDVQTMETTASGYLGGMPLRILVGYRPELIADRLGLRPVAEERVVLVDARDLDPPEVEYLATAAVRHVSMAEVSTMDLPAGPIYLHIDLDVVNPDHLPGLLFPASGGPELDAVFTAIRDILATGRVVALGLACTWRSGQGAADKVRSHLEAVLG
jgi:arginase